jgi:hypothetical protein
MFGWLPLSVAALLLLAGSSAVIVYQFTRHGILQARLLLTGTIVAAMASFLLPDGWATAIQSWCWEHNATAQALHVTLDPGHTPVSFRNSNYCIPIRIDPLPNDVVPIVQWSAIDNRQLRGARFEWPSFRAGIAEPMQCLAVADKLHHLDSLQDTPIHIRGTVALRLARPTESFQRVCRTKAPFFPYSPSPWFGPIESCEEDYLFHTVGYIQRTFDLGPLRLADYLVKK